MADAQRVIEFLRDVRQGGVNSLPAAGEELSQMAAAYAALCAQTNERLRQCSAFLQQGLRSEAIHLAEQSPNLLDLVSQLDLPDPQAWAEFCQNNGLPVPPPLQFERAAQLNDAYAQEQPLEHLLARHRLLALSRAPIRERLAVLRQIAKVDAANGQWAKDVQEFEAARLKELSTAFLNAVKAHDDETLKSLMDEINRQQWIEPPPVDLAKAVAEAYARIQRAGVESLLKKLVEPMRDAFAAGSVQECQALVQRWRNIMATGGVSQVSVELMEELKPVATFVAEESKREEATRRFTDATKAFGKLLDNDAPDVELEAAYGRLKEFNREIPEELVRRYMNRKAGRRQEADRRFKTRMLAIGSVAAVTVIAVLVVAWLYTSATNASRWANRISEAAARRSKPGLDEARGIVEQLRQNQPAMLQEPKVAAAVNAYLAEQSRYDRDAARAKDFSDRLKAARAEAQQVLEASPGMEDIRRAAAPLETAIREANSAAREIAWADDAQVLSREASAATTTWKGLQEYVQTALKKETQAIEASMAELPANASDPATVARTQAAIAGLKVRLTALHNLPLLGEEGRREIARVEEKLRGGEAGAQETENAALDLQQMRANTSSATALRTAMDRFVTRNPDNPRSADFRQALEEMPAAISFEEWLKWARENGALQPASAQAAQRRAEAVDAFLAANPSVPIAAEIGVYGEYLRAAADALAERGTWQASFSSLLANPLLTDLQVMEVSNGQRYYTLGDPKRVERRINNVVSVSFETIDLKEITRDLSKRVMLTFDPPVRVAEKPVPAPHAKAILELADELKLINDKNWDTFGITFADRLAANTQMDVIVKGIVLHQLLKTQVAVAGGDHGVGDVYDRTISDLARQNLGEVYWFDPSRVTEGTRRAVTQIVAAMPPASAVKEKLAAGRAAMFREILPQKTATGFIMKNDAGQWIYVSAATAENGMELYALVTGASNTTLMRRVGGVTEGRFVIAEQDVAGLPQGTVVFAIRK